MTQGSIHGSGTILGSITLERVHARLRRAMQSRRLGKRWPPWPSRKRDRRSMRLSIATGARTHGPKYLVVRSLSTMDFRTKILPSHPDRAAIFKLSWHGFLVCAFAVMTFLAWATLRQALWQ
jgi:hypothetical protein